MRKINFWHSNVIKNYQDKIPKGEFIIKDDDNIIQIDNICVIKTLLLELSKLNAFNDHNIIHFMIDDCEPTWKSCLYEGEIKFNELNFNNAIEMFTYFCFFIILSILNNEDTPILGASIKCKNVNSYMVKLWNNDRNINLDNIISRISNKCNYNIKLHTKDIKYEKIDIKYLPKQD